MSHHHIEENENIYYLTHNNSNIFIYGHSEMGDSIDSGQPYMERFSAKEELKNRVEELGQVWRDPLLPPTLEIEELQELGTWSDGNRTISINDILI